jgi:uncharacterized protein (TIGR02246 family)
MRRFAGFPALLLAAGLAGCAPSEPGFTDADAEVLRAAPGQFTSALLAANWETFTGLLSDDVVFLPPNGAVVEGRQAVMAFLQGFPTLASFTASATDVAGHGDWAYARGTFSFTTAPDSGPPMTEQGKFLAIHRRDADGTWRITRDIWNSDLPLPAPAAGN